jgi:4-diphosphocytidyl-2-C-methyl-D-erythritol kinase
MNTMIDKSSVTWDAPAKLNLYLHVTGRQDDGYHTLDSLIVFTEVGDSLNVRESDTLSLKIVGPFAAALLGDEDHNLVLKAARLLADTANVPARAEITLNKRLPVAAGLGGGSTDAAAALKALMILWDINPKAINLETIAISLGADVPVCMATQSSFVGGIGERISPCPDLPQFGLLLINPNITFATADAFSAFSQPFSPAAAFTTAPSSVTELVDILGQRRNDLTADVISLCPSVGDILKALESLSSCRLARMTGSGATCFGLFDTFSAAQRAAATLERHDWWTMPTAVANT